MMKTGSASSFAPTAIYLQYHGDADEPEPVDDEFSEEHVTWCRDEIFRHDVRYVRWDLVERLLRDVMMTHADPNDAGHNQCDEDQCQWCEWASELFPQNESSDGAAGCGPNSP